jgi:hypothetical protein
MDLFVAKVFPAKFFPVRNLKKPKKFRTKVCTPGFFRTKIQIAGKFLEQSDSNWLGAYAMPLYYLSRVPI